MQLTYFFLEILCFMRYVKNSGRARLQMAIRRMSIACWITKATNTRSEYAFPLQQWLREGASVLRDTYIVRLVYFSDRQWCKGD
jgi:hypothetical protein